MSALDIARATYRDISLYAPNRAPAEIDLSDNTNLWGVPPAAGRAIHDAATAAITRYPALYVADVKQALADYLGVDAAMVVTGCGSDDVLDSAIRAFGEPGDRVVHPEPSFAMIPIFARMNGLVPVAVPLTADLDIDVGVVCENVGAVGEGGAKIVYLCSPNNPTGKALARGSIERIVEAARGTSVVIVDEAYAEFADGSVLDLLARNPHLVITRTLSKAFGLAGLRIGYAVGDPAVIAEIEKSRGPYKVNGLAERAAVAALTEDRAWVGARVREAIENRGRLIEVLRAMGLSPLPSDANFVLVPVEGAAMIDRALRERGVAVRPFSALAGIGDALRISVGPWAMLEQCLAALHEVLA